MTLVPCKSKWKSISRIYQTKYLPSLKPPAHPAGGLFLCEKTCRQTPCRSYSPIFAQMDEHHDECTRTALRDVTISYLKSSLISKDKNSSTGVPPVPTIIERSGWNRSRKRLITSWYCFLWYIRLQNVQSIEQKCSFARAKIVKSWGRSAGKVIFLGRWGVKSHFFLFFIYSLSLLSPFYLFGAIGFSVN